MNEEMIQEQENNDSVSLRIAQTIASVKKISERIIGYIQYDYPFVCQKYNATSNRPAKITPLERAIVGILKVDGSQDFVTIGSILGFDVIHDIAEKEILNHAIESMRAYGVIEGDDSYLSLTEKGNIFASTGERPESYKGSFDLWIDPRHPQFTGLKNCFIAECIDNSEVLIDRIELPFDSIKDYAEQQASNFQTAKLRYVLSEANYDSHDSKQYKVYVCFLQSVRDDVITTFVYDDHQNLLLPLLSDVIDQDQELKQLLLDKCITIECENDDAEILSNSTEKTQEQTDAENQLIADEDSAKKLDEPKVAIGNVTKDGHLHKKALYDSLSFEAELHNIFVNDNADEIWMVSPWIGNAFVHQRLPYIKKFLDSGKKIFIAYSKEEANIKATSSHGEMITPAAQKAIINLESNYPNLFFCVQLPAFHTKNVIEKKGEQCVMFTGSFNVLSFSVNEKQLQIRREEMALAHHQMAINKYDEYLKEFIHFYVEKTRLDLNTLESEDKDDEIVKYKLTPIESLIAMCKSKDNYIDFFNEIESKKLLAKNALWIKEVAELQKILSPFFEAGVISNKERFNLEKKFANLTRRYVNLTVSIDEKESFDVLYSKFKALPTGKSAKENNENEKEKHSLSSSPISEDIYNKMNAVLKNKNRGRFIEGKDIVLAKKLCGPQNKLSTHNDLLVFLVAINLLSAAIRIKIEKKMQITDVYNSLKRIINKGRSFPELSIFITESNGKNYLVFDIHRVQFRFEGVDLSPEQLTYINSRDNLVTEWNGTLSYLHTCELLDLLNK